jgi:glycosyltransferase involved in cell wall biosynthesis
MADERPAATQPPGIVIMGEFSFPYGTGASSRVFSYARGLQANGARVKVLCVEPTDLGEGTAPSRGEYRGVPYEYTYGRRSRPAARQWRAWHKATKHLRFLLAVRGWAAQSGGLQAIIVYTRLPSWIAASWIVCRATGAVLVHEDCELPYVWAPPTAATALRRALYEHVVFKAFDGSLVISTYLEAYCRRHLRRPRTLLVPILADGEQAAGDAATEGLPPASAARVVAFAGSLDHPEVLELLRAFALVGGEAPDARLELLGVAKYKSSVPALNDEIARLGLEGRVLLQGALPREALSAHLRAATVLALPRADGAFSRAGLPTKVAEYLASGTPTVLTKVGDLPAYLQDGVDTYFAPPGDTAAFAARLLDALTDAGATAVGERGRRTAAEAFDPVRHGARILDFIAALRGERGRGPA